MKHIRPTAGGSGKFRISDTHIDALILHFHQSFGNQSEEQFNKILTQFHPFCMWKFTEMLGENFEKIKNAKKCT